jgi:hypothetical protein
VIRVNLVLDGSGALVSASAQGHALHGSAGTDIVCAAVSVLMRTAPAVLEESGVPLRVETAGRGTLSMTVVACRQADYPLLRYTAHFLQRGIGALAREYPDSVGVHEKIVENSSIEVLED